MLYILFNVIRLKNLIFVFVNLFKSINSCFFLGGLDLINKGIFFLVMLLLIGFQSSTAQESPVYHYSDEIRNGLELTWKIDSFSSNLYMINSLIHTNSLIVAKVDNLTNSLSSNNPDWNKSVIDVKIDNKTPVVASTNVITYKNNLFCNNPMQPNIFDLKLLDSERVSASQGENYYDSAVCFIMPFILWTSQTSNGVETSRFTESSTVKNINDSIVKITDYQSNAIFYVDKMSGIVLNCSIVYSFDTLPNFNPPKYTANIAYSLIQKISPPKLSTNFFSFSLTQISSSNNNSRLIQPSGFILLLPLIFLAFYRNKKKII